MISAATSATAPPSGQRSLPPRHVRVREGARVPARAADATQVRLRPPASEPARPWPAATQRAAATLGSFSLRPSKMIVF